MKILWGESGTTVETTPGTWIVAVSENQSKTDVKSLTLEREFKKVYAWQKNQF